MPTRHQHVARDGQLRARARLPQGAVVSNAQQGPPAFAREVARDQFKFAHGPQA
jgi:hypothetical protein